MIWDVIVLGGGASGMLAALESRQQGARKVLLLEKNAKLGKKLLLTGASRCNLMNDRISPTDFPRGSSLVEKLLRRYSVKRMKGYWRKRGLYLKSMSDGRVFPWTERAETVLDVLEASLEEFGIDRIESERVVSLRSAKGRGAFLIESAKKQFSAKSCILATGGKCHPKTGSSGEGYAMAERFGHSLVTPSPALVPLKGKLGSFHKLQGQKWPCRLKLKKGGKTLAESQGDLLWTKYGVSGLSVLDISAKTALEDYRGLDLHINLFAHCPESSSPSKTIVKLAAEHPKRSLREVLAGLLPKRIARVCLEAIVGPKVSNKAVGELERKHLKEVGRGLENLSLGLTSSMGWDKAQITSGGVSLDEVSQEGLESLKKRGLFFCGEILDVHGLSGGYNLYFAWSSGLEAGRGAARYLSLSRAD